MRMVDADGESDRHGTGLEEATAVPNRQVGVMAFANGGFHLAHSLVWVEKFQFLLISELPVRLGLRSLWLRPLLCV